MKAGKQKLREQLQRKVPPRFRQTTMLQSSIQRLEKYDRRNPEAASRFSWAVSSAFVLPSCGGFYRSPRHAPDSARLPVQVRTVPPFHGRNGPPTIWSGTITSNSCLQFTQRTVWSLI